MRFAVEGRLPNESPELQQLLREMADVLEAVQNRVVLCRGTPENAVVGSRGQIALRLDGGATTTLYVKTSGDGTDTGWTAK